MKKQFYELVKELIANLPSEIELKRDGAHSKLLLKYNGNRAQNQSVPGHFFHWVVSHIKFVKRRCFCVLNDHIIGATIHKSGGLWITKIEYYSSRV